ncbi:MAG: hypothetical protein IJ039_09235 [Clostridia bacterium]|nr:hypothetical protein [Clostridia bacterium]
MKKRIFALILSVLMVFTCVFVTSCTPEDQTTDNSSTSTGDNTENTESQPQSLDNIPDVATMDGTPMVSKTAYKMARSGMVFATPTALSETANEGITLEASVEPSYATKIAVDWIVSFTNPESEWATGKSVTDYVTVTPTEDGSLTATLECLQPFGEQIIVKVVSRENAEISDTCPLEYMRRVESVSLRVGDDYVFTPGVNYADFEVATGNLGTGGKVTLDVDFTDVYTIESWDSDSYDATDLSQWGIIGGNSNLGTQTASMASFEGMTADGMKYTGVPNMCYSEFSANKTLYFDVDSLSDLGAYLIKDSSGTTYNIDKVDPALLVEILTNAKESGTDTIFWLEVIHPTNHRINFEIKLRDIVNSGVAPTSITLNQTTYNFNATELDYMIPKE